MGGALKRDEVVTTICTVVTARDTSVHNGRVAMLSPDAGEAKAPASRGSLLLGAGAALIFLAVAACSDPPPQAPLPSGPTTTVPRKAAADPGVGATSPTDTMLDFGDAVLGELMGDRPAAREAYLQLIGSAAVPTPVAARATMRVAQIESPASLRHALELAARAKTLAPTDPAVVDGVQRLQADVVLVAGAGTIRGPSPGTPLAVAPGIVPAELATQWAQAEARFERVNRLELGLDLLKRITDSIDERVYPTRALANEYLRISMRGGVAYVAAHYRIASLYADLAGELANARPPGELIYEKQLETQQTLAALELEYLAAAQRAYRDCLAAPQSEDSELWRVAAETDLRILEVAATSDRLRGRR